MADGEGCTCAARCKGECGCSDVDWTPQEILDLQAELALVTGDRDALLADVKRLTAAVMVLTVMAVVCFFVPLIAYLIWGNR
jgi:hypothetical protein